MSNPNVKSSGERSTSSRNSFSLADQTLPDLSATLSTGSQCVLRKA